MSSSSFEIELAAAKAAMPTGYQLVESGVTEQNDLIWNFADARWTIAKTPSPFKNGQKRPGFSQLTDVGHPVSRFVAVARIAK